MRKPILRQIAFVALFNLGTMLIVSQLIVFNNMGNVGLIYLGCFVLSIALSLLIGSTESGSTQNEETKLDT
jgi:hypothetical protein